MREPGEEAGAGASWPRPAYASIPRPRILAGIGQGPGPRCLLVVAPAGYGKTDLLLSLLRPGPAGGAYLALDESESGAESFLSTLEASLEGAFPLRPPSRPARGDRERSRLLSLLSRLPALPATDSTYIALDRFERTRGPALAALIAELPELLPPGYRLAIASRCPPALALAKLRLRSLLVDIGPEALAFSAEEAKSFLVSRGMDPDSPRAGAIEAAARGWPAALELLCRAARDYPEAPSLARPSGEFKELYDFVREELLEPLDPECRGFLRRTRSLEVLSPETCDALIGHGAAAGLIKKLLGSGLPLERLDPEAEHYRIPPLLREALAREERETGEAPPKIQADLAAEPAERLSPREIELLGLLSQGRTPDEASGLLFISPHTVRAHIRNIYAKLGVRRLIEALNRARALGYSLGGKPEPSADYQGMILGRASPLDRLPLPK